MNLKEAIIVLCQTRHSKTYGVTTADLRADAPHETLIYCIFSFTLIAANGIDVDEYEHE